MLASISENTLAQVIGCGIIAHDIWHALEEALTTQCRTKILWSSFTYKIKKKRTKNANKGLTHKDDIY